MDKSKKAVGVFDKLAEMYQDKYMDVTLYGDTFDFYCAAIEKENARLLELACGPGNITKYLLDKRPDLEILGTDLSPKMIELAKGNNPRARFQLMDCRAIAALDKKYDAIMCGFCLPYLAQEETEKLIEDAFDLLEPNGLLYLSTMEGEYSESGLRKGSTGDELFMHFYTAAFLEKILGKKGFTILKKARKIYQSPKGQKVIDLILIAQK